METAIGYYIIGACLLLWLGSTVWAVRWTARRWGALFYVPAEATITKIRFIKESTISSSDGPDSRTQNVLEVKYKFKVGEKEYRGKDEGGSWQFPSGSHFAAGSETPLYKGKKTVGDKIVVHYDPAEPQNNTLRRFAFFGGVFIICLVQLFLVMALDFIWG